MLQRRYKKSIAIVFVGEKLAGKEVAARYLTKHHNFKGLRFSKIVVDLLDRLHLPITRVNEMNLMGGLRERFGGGVLAQVIKQEIEQNKLKRIVIDGARHPAELEILKKLPGFLLVYLTAPLEIRYRRALARGEKVGESKFSLDYFKREEKFPTEVFIKQMGRKAKVKLINAGPLADLYKQIEEKIIVKYLKS
jgi:dephospho-CoA kinase